MSATQLSKQCYVDQILNNIDNCLARRVAIGVGATLPTLVNGSSIGSTTNSTVTKIPLIYPLAESIEPTKSNAGLTIGVVADDTQLSLADLTLMLSVFYSQQVSYEVIGPYIGKLKSGVAANESYVTTSSIFFDAIILGSVFNNMITSGGSKTNATSGSSRSNSLTKLNTQQFLQEAFGHGKAIAA